MNTRNEDLLTARQVQDRLKVDRITVYRMLKDGRLKGIKIGQQWRFPASEVDHLLGAGPAPEASPARLATFPTHCVETIQNLFSGVSELSAVVIDNEGQPLTEPSLPCRLCQLLESTAVGRQNCREVWRQYALAGHGGTFTCGVGLLYSGSPVLDTGGPVGWFLCGPALPAAGGNGCLDLAAVAAAAGLDEAALRQAAAELPPADADRLARMQRWADQAAAAIQSILSERSGFLQRLESIARISNLES